MKKRLGSILLCLCLVLGFVVYKYPATAEAAVTNELSIDGTSYGGSETTTTDLSGTGWSWDHESKELTLSGYNGGRIYASLDAFKIILEEGTTNTITVPVDGGDVPGIYNMWGNVDIYGKGNLVINNNSSSTQGYCISTKSSSVSGKVQFKQEGNVTLKSEN